MLLGDVLEENAAPLADRHLGLEDGDAEGGRDDRAELPRVDRDVRLEDDRVELGHDSIIARLRDGGIIPLKGPAIVLYFLLLVAGASDFWARPSKFTIVSGLTVVLVLAGLAGWCLVESIELRSSWGPEYCDLPSSPGPQSVRLNPVGRSPGYHVRVVRKEGRQSVPPLNEVIKCKWSLPEATHQVHWHDQKCSCNSKDDLFDLWTDVKPLKLSYEVTGETRPMLESCVLEVECPFSFRNHIAMGGAFLGCSIIALLAGAILAASAVAVNFFRARRSGQKLWSKTMSR
jgi:hypothetical protein